MLRLNTNTPLGSVPYEALPILYRRVLVAMYGLPPISKTVIYQQIHGGVNGRCAHDEAKRISELIKIKYISESPFLARKSHFPLLYLTEYANNELRTKEKLLMKIVKKK